MATILGEYGLGRIQIGDIVEVLYKDHIFFVEKSAADQVPRTRRDVGRIDCQNEEYIRLIAESYQDADPSAPARSTGFVILRSTILKVRKIGS
jgi:hypothetical protein